VVSVDRFLDNASFDAFNPRTNEILCMLRDKRGSSRSIR
jgi:hypothetical protein